MSKRRRKEEGNDTVTEAPVVLATLDEAQLAGLRRRQAIVQFARDRAFEAAEMRMLAEEGYVAYTQELRDDIGLPKLFNVDMATGAVTAVPLDEEEDEAGDGGQPS